MQAFDSCYGTPRQTNPAHCSMGIPWVCIRRCALDTDAAGEAPDKYSA